jgi:hypothetical protein
LLPVLAEKHQGQWQSLLPKVSISVPTVISANVEHYRFLVGDSLMDEVMALAEDLKHVRICYINSTAYGGGVAELLSRYLSSLQGLKVSAEWRLIHRQPELL